MANTPELFAEITRLTGDGLCLCEMILDADGNAIDYRFLDINEHFEKFTGLADAKGRTALELVPNLEQHWIDTYARVGVGRETLRFENGSEAMGRWFEVYSTPAPDHGQLFIVFRDVTVRRTAELEREKALEQSRKLFEELGHRVKNSLSIIAAIVTMEARRASEETGEALDRVSARIAAVSDFYDVIANMGSVDEIRLATYLDRVVSALDSSLVESGRINFETEFAEITLPSRQAISLGLIVNELATNSIKHAFAPGQPGRITIKLARHDADGLLLVSDNGNGHSNGEANGQATLNGSGLGTKLVNSFVSGLDGDLQRRSTDSGTEISIRFPLEAEDVAQVRRLG